MAEKQVTVRVKVDGSNVVQTFRLYGKEGEQALKKIRIGAIGSSNALKQHGKSVQQAARVARGGGQGLRNLSLQLSQVAQQASATGDPLRALAIQLPDMTLGFGTLGIALGVVAGAALPLLVEQFFGARDSAAEMKKRVDELEAATARYREAAKNAALPTSQLRDEFNDAAGAARRLFDLQEKFAKLDMLTRLTEARRSIANQFGDLTGISEDQALAFPGIRARLNELNNPATNALGIDIRTDEQLAAANREVESLRRIMGQVAPAVARVREELDLSEEAASDFVAALVAARDAAPGEELIAAQQRLTELYSQAVSENEELTEEQTKTFSNLLLSLRAMIDLEAITGQASDTFAGAGANAKKLADEVSRAARAALEFVSNLGSANLAGIRAEVGVLEGGGGRVDALVARREAEIRSSGEFQTALQGPVAIQQQALQGLQREIELTRQSAVLSERRTDALKKLSEAQRKAGASGGGAAKSTEELTAAQRAAQQVISQAKAAAVGYSDIVGILDGQLASGAINQDTYNRALEKAKERFEDLRKGADDVNKSFGQMVSGLITGSTTIEQVLSRLQSSLLESVFSDVFESIGLSDFIPGFASGTNFAPGGLAVVGEKGPELVKLPRGSRVFSNAESQSMANGATGLTSGGGGGVTIINQNYTGQPIRTRRQRGPDGREIVVNEIGDAIGRGELDGAFGTRFAANPQKVRR